ncbi:RNA polymerase sigma factor [Dictyobacter arantiisoli]|nr:RNA polymerase sigma factor [Dictyobacter arantiisoli]
MLFFPCFTVAYLLSVAQGSALLQSRGLEVEMRELSLYEIKCYHNQKMKEHRHEITVHIKRKCHNAEDVDDLVQEVFLRFFKNLCNTRSVPDHPKAYLYAIAKSVCCDEYRKMKTREGTVSLDENTGLSEQLSDENNQPDDLLIRKEDIAIFKKRINELPEGKMKRTVQLLIEGFSIPEIAQKFNQKRSTISSTITQAKKRLQTLYPA